MTPPDEIFHHHGPVPNEQKNQLAVWALILGIVSIVCCGLVTGIPAILVGRAAEKAHAEGLATNGNLGKVSWILGIIGTAIWVVVALIYAIAILVPLLLVAGLSTTY